MRLKKLKLNKLSILFFIILGLIFIQTLFFAPQELDNSEGQMTRSKIQSMAAHNNSKKAVEHKIQGFHLLENASQNKSWELYADEASGSSDEQWILKKVKVEFFNENQSSFVVTGDIGEIDGQTKNMIIRGQVVTQSSNGYQFVTNDLMFVAKEKQLKSNDQVKMIGPESTGSDGFQLTGLGFIIELSTSRMIIPAQVEAQKTINQKNFFIESQRAEFSNKNQEALFRGQTKMRFGPTRIEAPQALFKYSEKYKALDSITLNDKVYLKDDAKIANCSELIMYLREDKMELNGQPKVQMGDDEIAGEQIVFLDSGKKVKINKVEMKSKELR